MPRNVEQTLDDAIGDAAMGGVRAVFRGEPLLDLGEHVATVLVVAGGLDSWADAVGVGCVWGMGRGWR